MAVDIIKQGALRAAPCQERDKVDGEVQKKHYVHEDDEISISTLIRRSNVLPGDVIDYISNNQLGNYKAVVYLDSRGRKKYKIISNYDSSFGKKRKRRRSKSSKQKKIQALAKKAMKIHHKEGISLKAAWRRVMRKSRFGYIPPALQICME